jgi:hypothetical protein
MFGLSVDSRDTLGNLVPLDGYTGTNGHKASNYTDGNEWERIAAIRFLIERKRIGAIARVLFLLFLLLPVVRDIQMAVAIEIDGRGGFHKGQIGGASGRNCTNHKAGKDYKSEYTIHVWFSIG